VARVPRRPPGPQAPAAPASAPAAPASAPAPVTSASQPACGAWIVDYRLAAGTTLKITDTSMGAGNGQWPVGPGPARVRFTDVGGAPGPGAAALLDLQVATRFTVSSSTFGMHVKVATDGVSRLTPDACGVVARGTLAGDTLTFGERGRGYRARATLTCSGNVCGHFGAPPEGRSQQRTGPYPVRLKPLRFRDGVSHFSMPFVEIERTKDPKQVTHLKLEAQEVRRTCAPRPPCE
jgi:hypothetical protein